MNNFKQQTPITQGGWLTLRCGREITFNELVALAAQRQRLLPELAQKYRERDARRAALLVSAGGGL